ncbi:SRPBCC family protein [Streptomyces sp. NPDC053431]|uniref:SRPBCC family protein n=1 Tax=Streptomyces sp. NPDC053431 TaxID=3365703 RepID=UPI0037D77E99
MAQWHRLIDTSPATLWSVFSDGSQYARWVVGTHDTWELDDDWPAEGSQLGYSLKLGPWTSKGRTVSRVCEPQRRLELEAVSDLGIARIAFRLTPWGDGCLVVLDEHPLRGTAASMHNAALDAGLRWRHRPVLARLAAVAEAPARTRGAPSRAGA